MCAVCWARKRFGRRPVRPLGKDRGNLGQDLVHLPWGQSVDPAATTGRQVQYPWLIATNDPSDGNPRDFNRKADATGKLSPAGDRTDNGQTSCKIEVFRRYDHHWPGASLLPTFRGVEGNRVDITPFHRSSFPAGPPATHSSSRWFCEKSDCAKSSDRVYFGLGRTSITILPSRTLKSTVCPDRSWSCSKTAGGTVSMVEPPTFLRVVVCIRRTSFVIILKYNLSRRQTQQPKGLLALTRLPSDSSPAIAPGSPLQELK